MDVRLICHPGLKLKSVVVSCFLFAVIEPCMDSELKEFPLRMRDWLKNVLVTLYERDEDNNLLTEKQKLRVSRRCGERRSYSQRLWSQRARFKMWLWMGMFDSSSGLQVTQVHTTLWFRLGTLKH